MSALRLLSDATTSHSAPRLALDTLSSLRTLSEGCGTAAAPRRGLTFAAVDVTKCATLMNSPG